MTVAKATQDCSRCRESKPLSAFHRDRSRQSGVTRFCKACNNAASRDWKTANPERRKAAMTAWRTANPQAGRAGWLRKRYGLTLDQYDELLTAQGGRCAICGATESGGNGDSLRVDHDHSTGRVRALLCHSCNTGIGHFRENPVILRTAAEYMELFS